MNDSTGTDLLYFTHWIDGVRYGGWFRMLPEGCIEVLAIGFVRTILLHERAPEVVACEALEEFIRIRKLQGAPVPGEPADAPTPHHECADDMPQSATRKSFPS